MALLEGARARRRRARADEANALYAALAGESHFYGMLAAEALGHGGIAAGQRSARSRRRQRSPRSARSPAVRRAVKLAELDMRAESQREWLYIVRGRDDDALLLAADYARRAGLYDRAINTAERTDGAARFRAALPDAVPRAVRGRRARPGASTRRCCFGIARQESRFAPDIVSSAGAVGLMQLMPPTARWVAKQLGRSRLPAVADRATSAINTQFGAFYFKYWLDRLDAHAGARGRCVQCGPGARAGVAHRRAARRRDLGRDDSVQRDARLREEGARQHDVLARALEPAVRAAVDAARHRAAARDAAAAPTPARDGRKAP